MTIVQFVASNNAQETSPFENNGIKKGLDIHNLVVITLTDPQIYLVAKVGLLTRKIKTKTHLEELIFKRQNSSTSNFNRIMVSIATGCNYKAIKGNTSVYMLHKHTNFHNF